jgi:hypothetical protein
MFGPSGIVRLDGVFPTEVADAISGLIWDVCHREFGIEQDRPDTWGSFRKRPLEKIASSPWFDEILTDRLAAAVDDLLGVGSWDWPGHWGDFLITFPNAATWTLSGDWHQDWSFDVDCDPPRWCKAFVFLNEVGPGGGGTLVVTGSHRLHGRYGSGRVVGAGGRVIKGSERLYEECDYLRELSKEGDDAARRRRFMAESTDVDGVDLQVVELTGRPGDVVIIHPWLVHAVAPNAAAAPRFMRAPIFGAST